MHRQHSIRRETCPRDQSLLQAHKSKLSQSLQFLLRQSLALIHNKRKVSNSHTISFEASSEDKGCVLWNGRAFMVKIMASLKD